MPRVIQVIESEECRGKGTEAEPFRTVRTYHTLDGEFLAEHDPPSIRHLMELARQEEEA